MGWVQQPLWLFLIISLAEKISFKTFNARWTCCVMKSSLSYLWPAAPWQLCHSREHSAEQNQLLTVSCHSSHLQRRDGHWIQWMFLLRSRGDCWEQWKQAALLQKLWGCARMGQSKTQGNCGCCRRCHCDKSLYGGKKKGSKSGVEGVGGRAKRKKKKITLRWAVCCILVGNIQVEIYSLNELKAERHPWARRARGSPVPCWQGNAWGRWAGCRGGQHCSCSLHAKGQKLPRAVFFFLNNNLEQITSSFSPQHHTPTNAILINISTLEEGKRYFDLILLHFLKLLFSFCIFVPGRSIVAALVEE